MRGEGNPEMAAEDSQAQARGASLGGRDLSSASRLSSSFSRCGPRIDLCRDPPPPIMATDDSESSQIPTEGSQTPQGHLGSATEGALHSEHAGEEFVDKRFLRVRSTDIGLPLKRARMVLRKSVLANDNTIMEREVLMEVIEEDRNRWGGCVTLPVSIMFFVCYLLAVVFHEAVTYTYITIVPIREALQQGLVNVTNPEDVYTWLQQTYLPFLYAQYDMLGNPLPEDRWSVAKQYSQLVGASQLVLQRSAAKPCQEMATYVECYPQSELTGDAFGADPATLPPPIGSVSGGPWALAGSWTWWNWGSTSLPTILRCGDEGFTSTGCGSSRRLLDLRYETTGTMPTFSSAGPTYEFVLDTKTPYAQLYNRIEYLKQRGWLDAQSTTLVVKAIILNNQYSVPRIIYVNTYFYFSRGGGVFADLRVEGKALTMWGDRKSYLADFLFTVILILRSGSCAAQIGKALATREYRKLRNTTFFFASMTVCLSWFNILFMWLQETMMGSVRKSFEGYLLDPSTANSADFYEKVAGVWSLVRYARPLVAYANFFFLCQIIIALQWQPRLSVVTQTLLACGSDLIHYLIVLTLTITAFALSGMVIFGRRIMEFADPRAAVGMCFKIAIESEYDWRLLSQKEWATSFCWVILYLLLVVSLMVNMVLAIIMDVYAEVRNHSGDSMTVVQHLIYIRRRLRHRAHWISDVELLDQVSEMPQHISIIELRGAFPDMPLFQLEYLKAQCFNKAAMITRVGLSKSCTCQLVAAISLALEETHDHLERMRARGWMGVGLETGSDESREWVKDIFTSIAAQNHWMSLASKQISLLQLRVQGTTWEEEDVRWRKKRHDTSCRRKTRFPEIW